MTPDDTVDETFLPPTENHPDPTADIPETGTLANIAQDRALISIPSTTSADPVKDDPLSPDASRSASNSTARSTARWRKHAVVAALAALSLAAGVGVGIMLLGRDGMMAGVSDLSAWVGLREPPGVGLDISDVTSFREETPDGDVLVVEGRITNIGDEARPLPNIRVALFDTADTELQHVIVRPDQEVLVPDGRFAFSARLEKPALTARRIKVSFARRREHG